MTDKTVNLASRRKFMQLIGCGACGGLAVGTASSAFAGGHAKVNPEDPQPQALGYVEDATTTDADNYVEGSNCSKCALYSGEEGKAYGPCGIFPGQEVSATGWCTAFAAKG